MSNSEEMRRIMKLMESTGQTTPSSAVEVESVLQHIVANVAAHYEQFASDEVTSTPSAPNTGKFTAPGYSMIEPKANVSIPDGMFTRNYVAFVKVGSNVDSMVKRDICNDVEQMAEEELGIDLVNSPSFTSADGQRYIYNQTSGTAWGGCGFFKA